MNGGRSLWSHNHEGVIEGVEEHMLHALVIGLFTSFFNVS